jgi:hypothetical protein
MASGSMFGIPSMLAALISIGSRPTNTKATSKKMAYKPFSSWSNLRRFDHEMNNMVKQQPPPPIKNNQRSKRKLK